MHIAASKVPGFKAGKGLKDKAQLYLLGLGIFQD
jgi:nucleoid DNA-binding protein